LDAAPGPGSADLTEVMEVLEHVFTDVAYASLDVAFDETLLRAVERGELHETRFFRQFFQHEQVRASFPGLGCIVAGSDGLGFQIVKASALADAIADLIYFDGGVRFGGVHRHSLRRRALRLGVQLADALSQSRTQAISVYQSSVAWNELFARSQFCCSLVIINHVTRRVSSLVVDFRD
jgi:hypothetical protein